MVLAMVLAGLRRCEVLGLRIADVRVGDRRLFVAEGKGGHQRVVPAAGRFWQALGDYLHDERPAAAPAPAVRGAEGTAARTAAVSRGSG